MSQSDNLQITRFLLKRKEVTPKNNYSDYRDDLRLDFCYSCAYCTLTEAESQAQGFNIDHYIPRKTFKISAPQEETNYLNLLWSCTSCNRLKGDFHPNIKQEEKKIFILRPDQDDLRDHYVLEKDKLVSKTLTGEFNIEQLRLNRRNMERVRNIRRRNFKSKECIAYGISRLKNINIDNLSNELKPKAFSYRKTIISKAEDNSLLVDKLIEDIAKSEFIDNEDNRSELMKKRKEYLDEIKAIQ